MEKEEKDKILNEWNTADFREFVLKMIDSQEQRIGEYETLLLKKCVWNEVEIHFIGRVKAGKSFLINSLLGAKYASSDVTPETATITRFRYGDKNELKITFYNKKEWKMLLDNTEDNGEEIVKVFPDFKVIISEAKKYIGKKQMVISCRNQRELEEEIRIWTSAEYKEHFYVKMLDVSSKELKLPKHLVLVDTPGLDDILHYRSQITKNYMRQADFIFHCRDAKEPFTESDTIRLKEEYENIWNKENIYVIGTKYDGLNNPRKAGEEMMQDWQKHLSVESLCGNWEKAQNKIFLTAARLFDLLIKDEESEAEIGSYVLNFLHEIPEKKLTEEQREKLERYSGIRKLQNFIQNLDIDMIMLERLKKVKLLLSVK